MADPEPDIIRSDPANRDNDYYGELLKQSSHIIN